MGICTELGEMVIDRRVCAEEYPTAARHIATRMLPRKIAEEILNG
jgi:hypothetical protein